MFTAARSFTGSLRHRLSTGSKPLLTCNERQLSTESTDATTTTTLLYLDKTRRSHFDVPCVDDRISASPDYLHTSDAWQDSPTRLPSSERPHHVKFRIDRDTLADAVAWTARSLPNRPSVPVLAGLLIETASDGLTLSGFDYETSTRATLPAEVSADGRALVSGRLLAEIVKSLPAKASRGHPRRHQGPGRLRQRPVQPADHAGRGVPAAARDANRLRQRSRPTTSRPPLPRRAQPLAATRCCRC